MPKSNQFHLNVPSTEEFFEQRLRDVESLTRMERLPAVDALRSLVPLRFEYVWTWRGVPIIRLPEDLMIQQELISGQKFTQVVEIGVARAGGMIFSADIISLSGQKPKVIGIDNVIHDHARKVLSDSHLRDCFHLIEGDSTDPQTSELLQNLLNPNVPTLFILDSSHTSSHVLSELRLYGGLCSPGSIIMVCDTLIDEIGQGFFPNRPWNDGKGPMEAVTEFMETESNNWDSLTEFSNRGFLSGIRNGVLRKR